MPSAPQNAIRPTVLVRRRSGAVKRTPWAIIISVAIHLIVSGFLAVQIVRTPPPETEAVIHVRLEVPLPPPPELEEAPIDVEGFVRELQTDGLPVPTDDPADHVETPDEVERDVKAKGAATGRAAPAAESGEPVELGPVVVGLGGGPGETFGAAEGGGVIESSVSEGARKGLRRFRTDGLDIVVCFDISGSMSDTLEQNKADVRGVVELIGALVPDVRVGFITYNSDVVDTRGLTRDLALVTGELEVLATEGGGDECVEAALMRALEPSIGWRSGAWHAIVLVGDEPPDSRDRAVALRAVRKARKGDPKLIVSTYSAASTPVESYPEIAQAGAGESLVAGQEASIGQALIRLAFGKDVGPEVAAWVAENPEAVAGRWVPELGLVDPNAAAALLASARDESIAPAERLDALLTYLRGGVTDEALVALLWLVAQHPESVEMVDAPERIAFALGRPLPPASLTAAERRGHALASVVRYLGRERVVAAEVALVALVDRARSPVGTTSLGVQLADLAWALARLGTDASSHVLDELVRDDAERLYPITLIEAYATRPTLALETHLAARMEDDDAFRRACLAIADPRLQAAVSGLVAQQMRADDGFRERCLADRGGSLEIAIRTFLEGDYAARSRVAERLLDDAELRRRCVEDLGVADQAALGRTLLDRVVLAGDVDEPDDDAGETIGAEIDAPAELRRAVIATLSELHPDAFEAVFETALGPAPLEDAGSEALRSRASALLVDTCSTLPDTRFRRLVTASRLPLELVLGARVGAAEAADPSRDEGRGLHPEAMAIVVDLLENGTRPELRMMVNRVRALSKPTRADLAVALHPVLERASGMRRRNLYRLFGEMTDARGLDLVIASLRWDDGMFMASAFDVLRRLTELELRSPAGTKKGRARQVLEVESWYARVDEAELGLDETGRGRTFATERPDDD